MKKQRKRVYGENHGTKLPETERMDKLVGIQELITV